MSSTPPKPALSRREIEVALGIGQGSTCREIGDTLDLKYETVRSYVNRLRDKTGMRRKPQLAVWATAHERWLRTQLKKARIRV